MILMSLPASRGTTVRPGPGAGVVLAVLLFPLAGCQPARESAPGPPAPVAAPKPPVSELQAYRVLPAASELRVLVYRAGPLANMGHNHVISSTALAGEVLLAAIPTESRLSIMFPVTSLEVDNPALRAAEGADFPGGIDAGAIAGTRSNMLGDGLLQASTFPDIHLSSREITGSGPDYILIMDITVRGVTGTLRVPAHVEFAGNRLTAAGELSVNQTDLGLAPFSVMGGLLSVRDQIGIRFRITAERG